MTIYKDFYIYYVKGQYLLDDADGDKLLLKTDSLKKAIEYGGKQV